MRARATAVLAAVMLGPAALACAGCGRSGGPPAASGCWQDGLRAIERHDVIRSVPPACAGLSHAQLNEVVASAVRAAAGPHRKAVERRIAAADGRYLAALVRGTGPRPPASAGSVPGSASAGSASPGSASPGSAAPGRGLSVLALASWLATVAAGGYLLAGHRGRGRRLPGWPPAIAAGHAAVAVAGLAVWVAFGIARGAALAWAGTGLVIGAAGLGMAVLLTSVAGPELPGSAGGPAARAAPAPRRVLAIASHVTLAVLTMLLVVLAATGAG